MWDPRLGKQVSGSERTFASVGRLGEDTAGGSSKAEQTASLTYAVTREQSQ